jgi:hypothetical protein
MIAGSRRALLVVGGAHEVEKCGGADGLHAVEGGEVPASTRRLSFLLAVK